MPGINYPQFPSGLELRLEAVAIAANKHKNFFDDPACPYSDTLKSLLQKMVLEHRVQRRRTEAEEVDVVVLDENADKFDKMLHDLEKTIRSMEVLDMQEGGIDASDRIQIIKAKTSLLEKWVNIKEKIYSIREIAEFQNVVIEILDTVVDKDQRKVFMDKLRALKSTEDTVKRMTDVDAV